jgi:hypothetical protein
MSVYYEDPDEGVALNLNAQVGPFGATVNGALGLLTDATLLGQIPAPGSLDRGVTRLQAFKWVQEFTASVSMRIGGTQRIIDGIPDLVGAVWTTCRDLVQLGTAARIEGARGRSEYAATLWSQYSSAKADLLAFLGEKLPEESAAEAGGPSGYFPCVTFGDWTRW